MEIETIFTIIIIPGIVWGGFMVSLIKAIRKEKNKDYNGEK